MHPFCHLKRPAGGNNAIILFIIIVLVVVLVIGLHARRHNHLDVLAAKVAGFKVPALDELPEIVLEVAVEAVADLERWRFADEDPPRGRVRQ